MPRVSLLILSLVTWAVTAAEAQVAIRGTSVLDVRAGTLAANRLVLIHGDRVVAMGHPDSVHIPAGTMVIDGTGTTVLPGLLDLHTHPMTSNDLELFLANGVTGIQALNAHDGILALSQDIASGRRVGPAVHACRGPISELDTPSQAMEVVRRAVAEGIRCLKPYNAIADSTYVALLEASRHAGIRTVSHIPRNLRWQDAMRASPNAIAHAEEFLNSPIESDADIDSILTQLRRNGIGLISTLTNFALISEQLVQLPELLDDHRLRFVSPVFMRTWSAERNRYLASMPATRVGTLRRLLTFQRELLRQLDSAGGTVLAGTDAGNNFVLPGWSLHDELRELVASGLSPITALRSATLHAAQFLGDSLGGVVEAGHRADLVLVRGNPLADIGTTRLIVGVVRNGVWFPRDSLRARLDRVAASYAPDRALVEGIRTLGLSEAIRTANPAAVPTLEGTNELGYQYWRLDSDTTRARQVFEANTRWHPGESMAWTTLAEFKEALGDATGAREANRRAALIDSMGGGP